MDVDGKLNQDIQAKGRAIRWEVNASDLVTVRILLPAQRVLLFDREPVGLDPGPRMARRAQPDRMTPEIRWRRIAVVTSVLDQKAHAQAS